jgi:hypothetical protein
LNVRTLPRRDLAKQRRQRRLLGVPELRLIEPETKTDSTLEFLVLCEFLAGLSIDQTATQFRMSSEDAQKLIRSALLQYGFHSVRGR